ncbi:MAG: DMT family transporter [Eubacterium sp.]|nr:DMT family transporter [Eubacterium sp.]
MQTKHKIRNIILLFLTAMIWGLAFVAQSVSMDYIGAMTFIFLRSLIGGMVLVPFILLLDWKEHKSDTGLLSLWKDPLLLRGGIVCGIFLFLGNAFQQNGIKYTTVGKAGFITTFYIIIIPIIGIFFKKFCGPLTWIAVVIALAGLYFLCINEALQFQFGDLLILICAFMFSGQVLAIDHYNQWVNSVKLSCIQFLVCGVIAFVLMLATEKPDFTMIRAAAIPILYTGIMSTGVAYTLQTVGQKGMNPTVAALILSMESVFSALAGFFILHQVLSVRELLGCGLMFIAIILAQLPDRKKAAA